MPISPTSWTSSSAFLRPAHSPSARPHPPPPRPSPAAAPLPSPASPPPSARPSAHTQGTPAPATPAGIRTSGCGPTVRFVFGPRNDGRDAATSVAPPAPSAARGCRLSRQRTYTPTSSPAFVGGVERMRWWTWRVTDHTRSTSGVDSVV